MKISSLLYFLIFFTPIFCSIPFTVNDLHQLDRLSGPSVSPDGKYVVFSVQKWDPLSGQKSNNLKYTRISDKQTFDLTTPTHGIYDTSPVFSTQYPNFVFFLSNRKGVNEIYYKDFPSNPQTTITALTNYGIDIDNLKISGKFLSFSAEIYLDCPDFNCTISKDAIKSARGTNTYTVYDNMFVRHWDKWDEGKISHIFMAKFNDDKMPSLNPEFLVDTLKNLNSQSPVPPDGGSEQYDLSNNGAEIVLTAQDRTKEESWTTNWKLYHIVISESNNIVINKLTGEFAGRTQNPRFSPNGEKIAFLAMDRERLESDSLKLWVYDKIVGTFKKVDKDFDRSIDDFIWIDNENLMLLGADHGTQKVFRVKLNDSPKIHLEFDDFISTNILIKIPNSENIISQRNSFTNPDDLWIFSLNNSRVYARNQLTYLNSEKLQKFELIKPEIFSFPGGYNDQIQAWIFKPINYIEGEKYPLAFLIHGGPESPWLQSWSYRWNPQLWASHGYAVLMINPHGSPGQGQKFTDAVINDWGGVPYKDLMDGYEYTLKKYGFVDGNRACAVGASYGGYMVNWIQGQTDRFKCLVTHDGVFSTLTMFYATEEIWFPMAEYCPQGEVGCTPWQDKYREGFTKFSPESYVKNWKTPHLIIHGSNDFRIPISEGLSAFTALQVRGVPSRFIHFHEENHWVLRRENSIKWYEEVLGWLDKWTIKESDKIVEE